MSRDDRHESDRSTHERRSRTRGSFAAGMAVITFIVASCISLTFFRRADRGIAGHRIGPSAQQVRVSRPRSVGDRLVDLAVGFGLPFVAAFAVGSGVALFERRRRMGTRSSPRALE